MSRIEMTDVAVARMPDEQAVRLACRVTGGGLPHTLWFEAKPDTAAAFSDRGNWAAVALLYPAMRLGADLHVDAPMSPQLLDALNHDAQAFLRAFAPELARISVTCRGTRADGDRGPLVATGFSAGIDSFATLARYRFAPVDASLAVSALAVFDVGAFGKASARHFARAADRCTAFGREHGMLPLALKSNLDAFYRAPGVGRPGFEKTNTFRNVAAALALEAAVGRYYLSSSFSPTEVGVRETYNSAYLDPVLLPLLSTERLQVVSSCAGLSRVEKTRLVTELPAARTLLDVCVRPQERGPGRPPNCSHCLKCVRTLFTLEALGRIDDFAAVFDVAAFRRGRDRFLGELQRSAAAGKRLDAEVVQLLGLEPADGRRRPWWFRWG